MSKRDKWASLIVVGGLVLVGFTVMPNGDWLHEIVTAFLFSVAGGLFLLRELHL